MTYAGRLDPMASGKLLILIGEECKNQNKYHNLDKEYEFEVLFGVESDTGDVLGLISNCVNPAPNSSIPKYDLGRIAEVCKQLIGKIELPYPNFSSKTVDGKPLHVWTLEGRLNEIEIPTKKSEIYKLELIKSHNQSYENIYQNVTNKIETIPKVTEVSKALGNDFRRPHVRESWRNWNKKHSKFEAGLRTYWVAKFRCVCSSGTYMRTLAEVIAKELNTCGLAYSIHRTKIGKYQKLPLGFGYWGKLFK